MINMEPTGGGVHRMFCTEEKELCVQFEFSSELCHLGRVLEGSEAFLQHHGVHETSDLTLVLRELLSNAIVHGNGKQPGRTVICRIEHTGQGGFRITVEDEGEGFDFLAVNTDPPEDPREIPGRGYILIHAFSQKVEFNERGNRITADVVLPQGHAVFEEREGESGVPGRAHNDRTDGLGQYLNGRKETARGNTGKRQRSTEELRAREGGEYG